VPNDQISDLDAPPPEQVVPGAPEPLGPETMNWPTTTIFCLGPLERVMT